MCVWHRQVRTGIAQGGGGSGRYWGPSARFPCCKVLRSPSALLLSLSAQLSYFLAVLYEEFNSNEVQQSNKLVRLQAKNCGSLKCSALINDTNPAVWSDAVNGLRAKGASRCLVPASPLLPRL